MYNVDIDADSRNFGENSRKRIEFNDSKEYAENASNIKQSTGTRKQKWIIEPIKKGKGIIWL